MAKKEVVPAAPTPQEKQTATEFELAEAKAALESANRTNQLLRDQINSGPVRGSLDPESLKHPNAFQAQDGRTYYKYELDGEMVVTPKPIEQMSEEDFYKMPISLYDNQPGRLPNNLTVKFKDPQWAGHWFNRKAGDGARISVGSTLGFLPAKIEDLEFFFKGLNDKDGAVEQHDLVLMKIHKAKLFTKFASWIAISKQKGGINAYKDNAANRIPQGRPSELVSYYHTPQAINEHTGLGAPLAGQ